MRIKENLICGAFSSVAGLKKMFSPRDILPHPDHGNISQRPGKSLESPEYQLLLSGMGTLGFIPLIAGLLEDEVRYQETSVECYSFHVADLPYGYLTGIRRTERSLVLPSDFQSLMLNPLSVIKQVGLGLSLSLHHVQRWYSSRRKGSNKQT